MRMIVRALLSAGLLVPFAGPATSVRAEDVPKSTADLLAEYRARLNLDPLPGAPSQAKVDPAPETRRSAPLDLTAMPESIPNMETVSAYQRRAQKKLDESERSWKRITSSICAGCGTSVPPVRSVTVNPSAVLARRLPPSEPAVSSAELRVSPMSRAVTDVAAGDGPGRAAPKADRVADAQPVATGTVAAAKAARPARVAAAPVKRIRHAQLRRHHLTRKQLAARAARRARLAMLRSARRQKQVTPARHRYVARLRQARAVAAAHRRFVSLGAARKHTGVATLPRRLCTFSYGFLPGFGTQYAMCVAAR
ncbi:hypothetical protein [Methylobacterium durans]|uniref:Uncharacterized protein n=1 Tax=Methylobacterium durans TaxID=2202825 RepID=A0A2U8W3J6_9HYPH|nr:hypothetical protein [Methylobacterium durans]AWN40201.1 hypothetical protein DK389_06230 [Methylobacterium durans]